MTSEIIYNENRLRNAAAGPLHDESWKRVMDDFSRLSDLIKQLRTDRCERLHREEREAKIQELKKAPAYTTVYFTGSSTAIAYGQPLIKIRNGNLYMRCQVGSKKWRIPFEQLSLQAPDEVTIKVNNRIIKLLSE